LERPSRAPEVRPPSRPASSATTLHPPSGSPALEIIHVSRWFGERAALNDVSLSLPGGRTLVVLGSNGAGKTTLLRVLGGLLRPNTGKLRVLGNELPREAWRLRGRVGWLGHEPLLYRELSARENLSFYACLHGVAKQRVDWLLHAVGMTGRSEEPLRELSRGMVQRVAAARALLSEPELLLLDEPLANLDPAARERLAPLIGRTSPTTRVLTSHDPAAGVAEADFVLGLRRGRPLLCASSDAIDPAELAALYR
jgi:heme exporter protein A